MVKKRLIPDIARSLFTAAVYGRRKTGSVKRRAFRGMTAAVLAVVFGFSSCSFGLPQSVRIRGLEVDLDSRDFDMPYALDKFRDSLSEDTSVSLYNPGDGIQHLLVRMRLEQSETAMPEIAGLGEGELGAPLSFNVLIPGLSVTTASLNTFRIQGAPLAYTSPLINALVKDGYLDIKPVSPIQGFNLDDPGVSVLEGHFDFDQQDYLYQPLNYMYHTDTNGWRFDLSDITLYNNSCIYISGLAPAPPGTSLTVSPTIEKFSSITLGSATSITTSITLMKFGAKGDLNPEELADYIYRILFHTLDIKFELNRKAEGLTIEFFHEDDTSPTPVPFAEGTSSLADNFLTVSAEDLALNIVDPSGTQILHVFEADVKLSAQRVTLEDVSPMESPVVVTATPQFPPDFRLKQAVVNPDEMPGGLDLNINIPDTAAGQAPINLAELLKAVDDFLPIENLNLSPGAFLFLNDDLPEGMQLKIEAKKGADDSVNLLLNPGGEGFSPVNDNREQIPAFGGNEYTGPLPTPALTLDGDKLVALLHSKPESLFLAIEAKLADPTTINFSEDASANTIIIKPELLMDLPLEFKLRADPPTANYAAIKLTQPDESEGKDIFGRNRAGDPLVNMAGATPEEISLSFDYVNTLGVQMDLALFSKDFDGRENFRRIIPIKSSGSGTCTVNVSAAELKFPFRAGVEALLPADLEENGGNYGVLKIVPGGSIRISELRADARFGLDLAGGL